MYSGREAAQQQQQYVSSEAAGSDHMLYTFVSTHSSYDKVASLLCCRLTVTLHHHRYQCGR